MTRLPFGRTPVTTAATSSSMLSERVMAPSPLVVVLESTVEPMVPSPEPFVIGVFILYSRSKLRLRLESLLRSDVLSSDALSLIDIFTVTTSPIFMARASRNKSAPLSCQNELPGRYCGTCAGSLDIGTRSALNPAPTGVR